MINLNKWKILKILLLLIYGFLNQEFCFNQTKVGINIGYYLPNATFTNRLNPDALITPINGFTGGILMEMNISDLIYFQSDFNYVQRGLSTTPLLNKWDNVTIPDSKEDMNMKYFEISLTIKFKFSNTRFRPYIFSGINPGIVLSATSTYSQPYENTTTENLIEQKLIKVLNFSIDAGLGFEFSFLKSFDIFLTGKYSFGLVNISNITDVVLKTKGFQIYSGIKFSYNLIELINLDPKLVPEAYLMTEPMVELDRGIENESKKETDVDLEKELRRRIDSTQKETQRLLIKEYDLRSSFSLPGYNVPFFVMGYYKLNIPGSLDELYGLLNGKLKNANYIEKFAKNSPKYLEYKSNSITLEKNLNLINRYFIDTILPSFKYNALPTDTLEISINGYADPRRISGKYLDDEVILFEDNESNRYTLKYGDEMSNLNLSGLRAFHTSLYFDKLFLKTSSESREYYNYLKESGRILFRLIGSVVVEEKYDIDAQRRTKVTFALKGKRK